MGRGDIYGRRSRMAFRAVDLLRRPRALEACPIRLIVTDAGDAVVTVERDFFVNYCATAAGPTGIEFDVNFGILSILRRPIRCGYRRIGRRPGAVTHANDFTAAVPLPNRICGVRGR